MHLDLANLPAHGQVTVTFDLYVIESWDGNSFTNGPDHFVFWFDDTVILLRATFSNVDGSMQSYPDESGQGSHPPQTGAAEVDTLGYSYYGDAVYRITARENADAGLPVGLVYAEGRGMLRDRAFAIARTQMFAPRYMQHMVGNVRVIEAGAAGIKAQSNYMLLQTLVDGPTTIHQAGRYYDTFVRVEGKLLLQERQCVYDTVIIANDLVYPV